MPSVNVFKVIEVWDQNQPRHVKCASAPIFLGSPVEITVQSVQALARSCQFSFSDKSPKPPKRLLQSTPDGAYAVVTPIVAKLTKPYDVLVLAPMAFPADSTLAVKHAGLTVHLSPKSPPIKAGTLLSNYSGEFLEQHPENTAYLWTMGNLELDARKVGGIGRFYGHLPTTAELKFYCMPDSLRESILLENAEVQLHKKGKEAAAVVVSKRKILPGEMIGYSYNLTYFLENGFMPVYYDQQGKPIDPSQLKLDKRLVLMYKYINHMTFLGNKAQAEGIAIDRQSEMFIRLIGGVIDTLNNPKGTVADFERQAIQAYAFMPKFFSLPMIQGLAAKGAASTIELEFMHQTYKEVFDLTDPVMSRVKIDKIFQAAYPRIPRDQIGLMSSRSLAVDDAEARVLAEVMNFIDISELDTDEKVSSTSVATHSQSFFGGGGARSAETTMPDMAASVAVSMGDKMLNESDVKTASNSKK